jgi:adenylyltransferase/sulfurtransferase
VELSNLQRQIAHSEGSVGTNKAHSAAAAMGALNPLIQLQPHPVRVDAANAASLVGGYDIICDGTDNFPSRFLLADEAWRAGKTLVSAAVLRFEGQLSTFRPGHNAQGQPNPCYRCLYPAPPPPGLVPSCAEAGVLGPITGVMGTLQATEVLKEILGIGQTLVGRLLVWDALAMRFRTIRLEADPACALCGAP